MVIMVIYKDQHREFEYNELPDPQKEQFSLKAMYSWKAIEWSQYVCINHYPWSIKGKLGENPKCKKFPT